MKRGEPLKRTEFKRKPDAKGLQRTEFKRKPQATTTKRKAPGKPKHDIPQRVRDEVRERSGDVCEICSQQRAAHMHHKERRRKDNHVATNLLHLCLHCHHYVHTTWLASGLSYAKGWLVRSRA